jgi:hypothetical protein
MSEPPEPLQQRVMDALEKYDADSRPARAARLVWLSAHQVQFGAIADRAETLAVLEEARTSFISGRYIAKLILALAYVENALADVLQPPPNLLRGRRQGAVP